VGLDLVLVVPDWRDGGGRRPGPGFAGGTSGGQLLLVSGRVMPNQQIGCCVPSNCFPSTPRRPEVALSRQAAAAASTLPNPYKIRFVGPMEAL